MPNRRRGHTDGFFEYDGPETYEVNEPNAVLSSLTFMQKAQVALLAMGLSDDELATIRQFYISLAVQPTTPADTQPHLRVHECRVSTRRTLLFTVLHQDASMHVFSVVEK
jgi:hypothetical protein